MFQPQMQSEQKLFCDMASENKIILIKGVWNSKIGYKISSGITKIKLASMY